MISSKPLLRVALLAACLAVVSCGTKKALDGGGGSSGVGTLGAGDTETRDMTFLRKVYDNEIFTRDISSKIKFSIVMGGKDLSVAGSLKMRKDEVIRVQLVPFGLMEVGRLEFAKDYVLIMDRLNKEYVKAGYDEVDFLRRNGLDFYALQALFWNQLYVPGTTKITDSALKNFGVVMDGASSDALITLARGSMSYAWSADKTSGRINAVDVTYDGKGSGKTSVSCSYGSFKPLQKKNFPTEITLKMSTEAIKGGKELIMGISISGFDTSSDWETNTSVSDKYKRVGVDDVMNRLLGM